MSNLDTDYGVGCPALLAQRVIGSAEDIVLQISTKLYQIFGGCNRCIESWKGGAPAKK
jgi:hypothetical protein